MWELSERGFSVVEEVSLYRIFSPLVQASRKRLEEELAGHRNLISTYYGESAKKAFQDLDGLNLSIAIESLNAQQVEVLERELARTRAQAEVAKQTSKVNQKERRELQILRAKDKEREARTRARKRAAESKRGKRTGSRAPGKQKRKPR